MKNLLFVADPLETFKTYKDSTFAMMREAAARGHGLLACETRHLLWQRGGRVEAMMRRIELTGDEHDWFRVTEERSRALADTDFCEGLKSLEDTMPGERDRAQLKNLTRSIAQ